ncbi:YkvA family protein [Desmospora activa]|uniref:Uncharacterized protein DUF1232 n=1 Tax=Desmospora activa DSM 45169 TaxID=1121389 RepID=A0A2T4Z3X1_9BACL|nr:YkvA family protein [Desmospora activa]PTM56584.1 uncharacterized protein DUF1232 [Desmospora activa DSM 45169]
MKRLQAWAKQLKRELYALYFAYRHPRTPWYAKLLTALVVAYAFSPIDLIPDFIPILGYLDDLVLLPLGIALALRMIPADVLQQSRQQAEKMESRPKNWVTAALILLVWLGVLLCIAFLLLGHI